jgi:hypothetical protein
MPGAHFHTSNTSVHVGKPFQYQAPVELPFSTTMYFGINLPIPQLILTIKPRRRGYFVTISSADEFSVYKTLLFTLKGRDCGRKM